MTVYKINDLIKFDFLKIPKSLFANPNYKEMSSDAKLTYALLYDRLSLSKQNNWINSDGEVYLVYTRKAIAEDLGITYKKAIDAFKELKENNLIIDKQCGRGMPNYIFIVKPELSVKEASDYTDKDNSRSADLECLDDTELDDSVDNSGSDVPNGNVKKCENGMSVCADTEYQEVPKPHTNKTNNIKTNINHTENSQSVTDRQLFNKILGQCQLGCFDKDVRRMFYDAIERLFYCNELKIGSSTLPGANVRSRLCELEYSILETALIKIHRNKQEVRNSTGYVMSVIFNCLTEGITETHIDPYLNHLRGGGD
jgi:hypothetical protein